MCLFRTPSVELGPNRKDSDLWTRWWVAVVRRWILFSADTLSNTDIEGHLGKDNRFYVIGMPPAFAQSRNRPFTDMFSKQIQLVYFLHRHPRKGARSLQTPYALIYNILRNSIYSLFS